MAVVVSSSIELAELVRPITGLVTFDGCPGAGKTTLMECVARELGCASVDVDTFIARGQGRYFDALQFESIASRLDELLGSASLVLFAGCRMLDILDRLQRPRASLRIYVQRITSTGLAGDLDAMDAEEGMLEEGDLVAPSDDEPSGGFILDAEILEYHARRKPLRGADVLYQRQEVP